MSSLPTYSVFDSNMAALGRVESSPSSTSTSRPPVPQLQVQTQPHPHSHSYSQQQIMPPSHSSPLTPTSTYSYASPYTVPSNAAFGYSVPYAPQTQAYSPAFPSPSLSVNGANHGYAHAQGVNMGMGGDTGIPTYGPYGFSLLPTIPPRYSMTGTPFAPPPNRGCISPLDLFGAPSAPLSTTQTYSQHSSQGPAQSHSAGAARAGANALGTPQSLMSPRTNLTSPSIMGTPALGMGLGLGLHGADTPMDVESAPDTNLASPCSSTDEMEEKDEDEDEVEGQGEGETQTKQTIKLKVAMPKSPSMSKTLGQGVETADGDAQPVVKKRSRTAQACERCRVRKARCFGGNPCNRCVKRKFVCEFTPSRTRMVPKPEPKPKARRHSMHVAQSASGPVLGSATTHAPLGRMHSHNHAIGASNGHARTATLDPTRLYAGVPPYPHHPMSVSVNGTPAMGAPGFPAGMAYAYTPHLHAHTHAMGQMPLPTVAMGASPVPTHAMAGMSMAYPHLSIPSYHGAGAGAGPISPSLAAPSSSAFSSSLGLSLGPDAGSSMLSSSLPSSGANAVGFGLGLGLELSPAIDSESSPESDVPGLSMSSYTSSNTSGDASLAQSILSNTGAAAPAPPAWSGYMDPDPQPIVEDDMFTFSAIDEHDAVHVVGWDEAPSPAPAGIGATGSSAAAVGSGMSAAHFAMEHLEGVRDAATRQLYSTAAPTAGVSGEASGWYSAGGY